MDIAQSHFQSATGEANKPLPKWLQVLLTHWLWRKLTKLASSELLRKTKCIDCHPPFLQYKCQKINFLHGKYLSPTSHKIYLHIKNILMSILISDHSVCKITMKCSIILYYLPKNYIYFSLSSQEHCCCCC